MIIRMAKSFLAPHGIQQKAHQMKMWLMLPKNFLELTWSSPLSQALVENSIWAVGAYIGLCLHHHEENMVWFDVGVLGDHYQHRHTFPKTVQACLQQQGDPSACSPPKWKSHHMVPGSILSPTTTNEAQAIDVSGPFGGERPGWEWQLCWSQLEAFFSSGGLVGTSFCWHFDGCHSCHRKPYPK